MVIVCRSCGKRSQRANGSNTPGEYNRYIPHFRTKRHARRARRSVRFCELAPLGIASPNFALHNEGMNAIYSRLEEIFRAVLLDDSVTITPETSGKDFEAWDSLTHVTVMVHVERAFDIQFTSSEISGWKNAGELAQLIESRLQQKG